MQMWTIYNSSDFPGSFVARKYNHLTPTGELIIAKELDDLRLILTLSSERELICIKQYPYEEPEVIESWL